MSTSPVALKGSLWLRSQYLVFVFVGLMIAYDLGHNERFLIDAKDPEWSHIQSFKWWLLPFGLSIPPKYVIHRAL